MRWWYFGLASALWSSSAAAVSAAGHRAWSGPYAGVQGGLSAVHDLQSDPNAIRWWTKNSRTSDQNASVGVHAGYDLRAGDILLGGVIEANLTHLNSTKEWLETPSLSNDSKVGTDVRWFGSARAKIGVAGDRLSAYASVGPARSDARQRWRGTSSRTLHYGWNYNNAGDRSGMAVGFGVASKVSGRTALSLEVSEYRFGAREHRLTGPAGEETDAGQLQRYSLRQVAVGIRRSLGRRFDGANPSQFLPARFGPWAALMIGGARMESHHEDLQMWWNGYDDAQSVDRAISLSGRLGYDYALGPVTLGVVGELTHTRHNSFAPESAVESNRTYDIGTKLSRLSSLRGRVGYTDGRLTVLASGGVAKSNATVKYQETDGSGENYSGKAQRTGYVVGLGAEYAFHSHLAFVFEAASYGFGSKRTEITWRRSSPKFYFDQRYSVQAVAAGVAFRL